MNGLTEIPKAMGHKELEYTPSDNFDDSSRGDFRDSPSNRDGSMAAESSVMEQGTPVTSTDQDSNQKSSVDNISTPDRPLPAQVS